MRTHDVVADESLRSLPVAARNRRREPLLVDGAAARADILHVMLIAENVREEALARLDRLASIGGNGRGDKARDIRRLGRPVAPLGAAPDLRGAARDIAGSAARRQQRAVADLA